MEKSSQTQTLLTVIINTVENTHSVASKEVLRINVIKQYHFLCKFFGILVLDTFEKM